MFTGPSWVKVNILRSHLSCASGMLSLFSNNEDCVVGHVKKQNSQFWFYRNAYFAVSIYTETYLGVKNINFKMLVKEKMTSEIQRKFKKIQRKLDHISFFRLRILKWTFDYFAAAGRIVKVLMKLLTPILTYHIFAICHLWYVIHDINVKYII